MATPTVVFGPTGHYPYSDADRALLRNALAEAATLEDRDARPGVLAFAERMVTDRHAEAVEALLRDNEIDPASIDIVGFHGQTVLHRPKQRLRSRSATGRRWPRVSASTSLMIFAPPTSPPAARARRSCPCSIARSSSPAA